MSSGLPRPGLAAVLGFIPGVGAMYNGEFAKGLVHVLIFATLIWMTDHISGIFGLGIAAFILYMPIEAYQTARAEELGLPAPDPFGFNNLFSADSERRSPLPALRQTRRSGEYSNAARRSSSACAASG